MRQGKGGDQREDHARNVEGGILDHQHRALDTVLPNGNHDGTRYAQANAAAKPHQGHRHHNRPQFTAYMHRQRAKENHGVDHQRHAFYADFFNKEKCRYRPCQGSSVE